MAFGQTPRRCPGMARAFLNRGISEYAACCKNSALLLGRTCSPPPSRQRPMPAGRPGNSRGPSSTASEVRASAVRSTQTKPATSDAQCAASKHAENVMRRRAKWRRLCGGGRCSSLLSPPPPPRRNYGLRRFAMLGRADSSQSSGVLCSTCSRHHCARVAKTCRVERSSK